MDDDLRKSLLTNKNAPFQRLYEECLVKIQRIKQKNDFLQRQSGEEIEESIAQEVRRQRQFMQDEILQLKQIIDEIEYRFKDPESRNKLKTIKADTEKQVQRNKIIMKDLINRSFMKRSGGDHDHEDQDHYFEGGTIEYNSLDVKPTQQKQSILTDRSADLQATQQIDHDYEMQRKIQQQKSSLLKQVEETSERVNAIISDMAVEVEEQGQNLDVITEELLKAQKNVQGTNEDLQQAAKQQKKSRKKYMCLVVLIILIVALGLGLVFILKK